MTLDKAYIPEEVENKIYQLWQKSGFFNPDKLPGKRTKSFTIVIPPPNVTGELHMGHALNATLQDILIRKKRMEGFKTLWLPGTDHAGIATQNVVERELRKEGKSRFDLGRDKFIERIWQWREKYGNIILNQFKKLGASCDWSRTRFTMDEGYVKAVETAFLHYHKKGWVYRGERVVNWCPRCQTSLSDLELEYKEEKGKLWYLRYPLKEQKTGDREQQIIVATTRPETMLGDTAVAVNPKDKRYKNLVGRTVILPIQNKEIPIIEDRAVDPKFGTGAVKVTPAHDITDWEIKERHDLKLVKIINERGLMGKESKICDGLKTLECREKVLEELLKQNLIEKTEDYTHSLPYCYRCHSLIEPIPSKQWFLRMDVLANDAIKSVKSGKVKFIPKRFEKIYFDWLKNIKDWCISRQIWWGHRIPIAGETDVLDTWFSSALWPFATLGWPETTKDLKTFYPTNVLSTARDIINLWVARMIFSGAEFMKKVPFSVVLIHPTVLTKDGKRMSKSLGTGVDPIALCEKYGADATRFGIAWQLMGGQDIKFVEDNIMMGKKFCNKIWNASRFVLMQIPNSKFQIKSKLQISNSKLTAADKKILKTLEKTVKSTTKDLETFQFGKAARALYDFFWHDFCDVYIEKSKSQKDKKNAQKILLYVLLNSLKLLHPFIPFITEEIYQKLPIKNKKECLMVEDWPN
ncbi:MAG: valine--tRNA ligase [Candidatus Pacebacteria bacterium]|nr:valine--tRNA ligase [Candidatus Paceibacterota bacterium]